MAADSLTAPASPDRPDVPTVTLDGLLDRYEVLLLDAYGVLVTATGVLPRAAGWIARLNREGREYSIVTNDASRLPETYERRFRGLGLEITAERVLTSGSLLERHFREHGLRGARCVFMGPEETGVYVERAGGRLVTPEEDFEVVVLGDEQGPPLLETMDRLLTGIFRRIDRAEPLHLVLPNPDRIYPKGGGAFGVGIGSIARMVEAALEHRHPGRDDLRFTRLGKPCAPIFEAAVARHGGRERMAQMVMIGDQLETDVRGARDFGLDSVLVPGGVTPFAGGGAAAAGVRPTWRLV
jgi:HAD superfamily hydrolase (TIGR01450 family)